MPDGQETRIVDPNTGGEKGSKLARFDLIPWDAVWGLAEHFGIGARKYEDRNWERGYAYGLSFAAMHRHAASWWMGEDLDPESGDSHLLAVAWHALALWWMQKHGKGTDDRPGAVPPEPPRRRRHVRHVMPCCFAGVTMSQQALQGAVAECSCWNL